MIKTQYCQEISYPQLVLSISYAILLKSDQVIFVDFT